jgi:hypothetical protein
MSVAIASRSSVQASVRPDGRAVQFIYHVPKCAGQTIDRHLSALLPNAYHRLRKRRGLGRLFRRYDLVRMPNPEATKALGGHFIGISLEPLFAGRGIERSILLRDPMSHMVSYYNYRMMRYISQGLQPYGFATAYGATQRNFITHYILRNFLELSWARLARLSDQEKYDLVNAFLATFWFVGDYTLCDDLVAALGRKLGIARMAERKNTQAEWECRVQWEPLSADNLSRGAIAQIERENLLDQRLWETWRDVGEDTHSVRPRALCGTGRSSFLANEAVRFVNQLTRRFQRRWGHFEVSGAGPDSPVAVEGASVLPVRG